MSKQTSEELEVAVGSEIIPVEKGLLAKVWSMDPDDPAVLELLPSNDEVSARIFAERMAAETEEEMLKDVTTWNAKDNVGVEFEIRDFRGLYPGVRSEKTGKRKWFSVWEAVNLLTGELGLFVVGADRIVQRLGWWYEHGYLPLKVEITEAGRNKDNLAILTVEKVAS